MKFSSEEQLLLGCAPSGNAENLARAVDQINGISISWQRALQLAHWHRMTGMLFAFLRDNSVAYPAPESDITHLREHYRHTVVRSMYIRSEFSRAVKALQAENIDVIALKGVALLGSAYQDSGVREMSDIDLLVRSEFADRAQEIIQGLGYEPVGSDVAQERTREVHRHLPKLHNHDRELSFEVHTHIVSNNSPLHFDIDTIWQHARSTTLHGVDVLVPSPEHMLMHLCLHFFLDRRFTSGSSLKQLHDLACNLRAEGQDVDWDLLLEEVTKYGLDGPVFTVLSTTATLLGVDIPEHVLDGLRPDGYSKKMEELFIRQRVLRSQKLTATELVPHEAPYTVRAMLKGVFRRAAPSGQYLEMHHGSDAIDAPGNVRVRRFGEMFKRGFGYVLNPLRLWQEVRVDRWLHSLSREGTAIETDERRSS